MTRPRAYAADVPILRPLFERLETLSWRGTALRDNPRWFVMGQICVADGYRGKGIVDGLYRTMAERYGDRFDFTVTEVATRNTRSLRAHARVGFQSVEVYTAPDTGEEWNVIALDFAECLARGRSGGMRESQRGRCQRRGDEQLERAAAQPPWARRP